MHEYTRFGAELFLAAQSYVATQITKSRLQLFNPAVYCLADRLIRKPLCPASRRGQFETKARVDMIRNTDPGYKSRVCCVSTEKQQQLEKKHRRS